MKSEEEVRWSEIFSSAYITKSLLEWGRKAEQPCSVQLKVLQKAFLGSLRRDIPLPPCPPLVRCGTAWSSSRSGGYHWSQVAAWGAADRPAVLAPPPPSPTAPEQQLLPCLFFLWKGGCDTNKARRVMEGTSAGTCSQLEMCMLSSPAVAGTSAAHCQSLEFLRFFSEGSFWLYELITSGKVIPTHMPLGVINIFKWLNTSGRKHT